MALNHVTSTGLVRDFLYRECGDGVRLLEDVAGAPLWVISEEKVDTHGPRCCRKSSVEAGGWNS